MNLRDQLQQIYDHNATLTPDLVVREASKPEHPLHSRFDWRDDEAAHKWRLHQAGELIRSVKISFKPSDSEEERTVRVFHAIRTNTGHSYEPIEKVVANPVAQEILLRDMEREWRQMFARYKNLEAFAAMVQKDLQLVAA